MNKALFNWCCACYTHSISIALSVVLFAIFLNSLALPFELLTEPLLLRALRQLSISYSFPELLTFTCSSISPERCYSLRSPVAWLCVHSLDSPQYVLLQYCYSVHIQGISIPLLVSRARVALNIVHGIPVGNQRTHNIRDCLPARKLHNGHCTHRLRPLHSFSKIQSFF